MRTFLIMTEVSKELTGRKKTLRNDSVKLKKWRQILTVLNEVVFMAIQAIKSIMVSNLTEYDKATRIETLRGGAKELFSIFINEEL